MRAQEIHFWLLSRYEVSAKQLISCGVRFSLTEKHLSQAIRKCPKRTNLEEAIQFTIKHEKPFLLPGV